MLESAELPRSCAWSPGPRTHRCRVGGPDVLLFVRTHDNRTGVEPNTLLALSQIPVKALSRMCEQNHIAVRASHIRGIMQASLT